MSLTTRPSAPGTSWDDLSRAEQLHERAEVRRLCDAVRATRRRCPECGDCASLAEGPADLCLNGTEIAAGASRWFRLVGYVRARCPNFLARQGEPAHA